jgi:hypothetical protein
MLITPIRATSEGCRRVLQQPAKPSRVSGAAARYTWQSPDHLLDGVSPCAASGSSIELGQHLTDDLRRLVSGERVAAFRLCDLSGKVFD